MEKIELMEQRCFERLSQLMADKGVIHEAFELLADLRMSERNFAEKAAAYDRLSTWHDDLPKNDGRYICVIGDGKYPIICAKKFENGRWLLGERGKIRWAYLPDGWEE